MVATAAVLGLATLPFVGLHSWRDWIKIAREATETYRFDNNWIHLSRDLLSIPRRWLDFSEQASWTERRDNLLAAVEGWALLAAVFGLTVTVAALRWKKAQDATGPGAAFVLLGAWLCCFHFMYYDYLLTCLPVLLLFTDWRGYLEPRFVAIIPLREDGLDKGLARYYQARPAYLYPPPPPTVAAGYRHVWILNRMVPTLVALIFGAAYVMPGVWMNLTIFPYDTLCIVLLWLWCGWLWLRAADKPAERESCPETLRKDLPLPAPVHTPQFVQLRADVRRPH
jgi:hypothetical protein